MQPGPPDVDGLDGLDDLDDMEFSRVGGHVAIDLLNTVDWRLDPDRRGDRLTGVGRVLSWGRAMDLITVEEHARLVDEARTHPRLGDRLHREVVAWREIVYDALINESSRASDRIVDQFQQSMDRVRLRPTGGSWVWEDTRLTLTTPYDRIVRATIDLLRDARLPLLHQCEDEACGWVYLDTSPRHNRRWCTASDCGNRNRARSLYQRRRADRRRPGGP